MQRHTVSCHASFENILWYVFWPFDFIELKLDVSMRNNLCTQANTCSIVVMNSSCRLTSFSNRTCSFCSRYVIVVDFFLPRSWTRNCRTITFDRYVSPSMLSLRFEGNELCVCLIVVPSAWNIFVFLTRLLNTFCVVDNVHMYLVVYVEVRWMLFLR